MEQTIDPAAMDTAERFRNDPSFYYNEESDGSWSGEQAEWLKARNEPA